MPVYEIVFEFSQAHFVGGLAIGLTAWLVTYISSKVAQMFKSITGGI